MAVSRAMTFKDFQGYVRGLSKNLRPAIVRGIHSGLMRSIGIVQLATTQAKPASPNGSIGAVNTGAYRAGWKTELTDDGGRLYNITAQSGVIEGGRKKGSKFPPLDAIAKWAQRRLGISATEAKNAAYPIAKAIAKRGLDARKVLTGTSTANKITKATKVEIGREIKAAMQKGKRR